MQRLAEFLRALVVTVSISLIMFLLLHLEFYVRGHANFDRLPTPPYVSVLAPDRPVTAFNWWRSVLDNIRFGL